MAKIAEKQPVVQEVGKLLQDAATAVLVDYRGITVDLDTKLRKQLREANVTYKIYKNTLVRIAVKDTPFEGLSAMLTGPTALAVSTQDATAPARIIAKFAETAPALSLKGGIVEGVLYDEQAIMQIAAIPSREELLAKFLGSIQSPVSNFARVISQIAKKKEEGADMPETAKPAEDTAEPAEETAEAPSDAAEATQAAAENS